MRLTRWEPFREMAELFKGFGPLFGRLPMRTGDVADEFDNHGACRFWQRDRFVNDAVFGDSFRRSQLADGTVQEHWTDGPLNVSTASFHPSSKGYDAYLGALRTSLPPELLPTR